MGASKKPFLRRTRLFILLMAGLVLLVAVEPHLFSHVVRKALIAQAQRHGCQLTIGKLEGNLFEPLRLEDCEWQSIRPGFALTTKIQRAEAGFSWSALLMGRGTPFFHELVLEGVESRVRFHHQPVHQREVSKLWFPLPHRIDLRDGKFDFQMEHRSVRLEGVRFQVERSKSGQMAISKAILHDPSFTRELLNLNATTALQGNRFVLTDLEIAPELWLTSVSTDVTWLAAGDLRLAFELAAFGGEIRGELLNTSGSDFPGYLLSGHFHSISVPSLARFLDVKEQTGGIINEGKFTFEGSPNRLASASLTTRLQASDFQWGARRWNLFTLGATLHNGRIEVPTLELQQANNTLKLQGELHLSPAGTASWLESRFQFNVDADIRNLTELSALFGPKFAQTTGQVSIKGAILGQNRSYTGQLKVEGSDLSWHGAPVKELKAELVVEGNELQINALKLANGNDFVQGKGGINIYGEKWYWAELDISVEELDTYRSLLQKPLTPMPLKGGMIVQWKGDGTMLAHSGAFSAKLRQLHSPEKKEIPPVDAEMEGTYSSGSFILRRLSLAAKGTRLDTRLYSREGTLRFEALNLTHDGKTWLAGEATLPINFPQWWQAPGLDALSPEAALTAALKAQEVNLKELSAALHKPLPLEGILSGELSAEGTLRDLRLGGTLKLAKGRLPAAATPPLDQIEAEAALDGSRLVFKTLTGRLPEGDVALSGVIDFQKFEEPIVDFSVESKAFRFEAAPWEARAALALKLTGTLAQPVLTGTATLTSLNQHATPDFPHLLEKGWTLPFTAPDLATGLYTVDLQVLTTEPIRFGKGTLTADLRYVGKGDTAPEGDLTLRNIPVATPFASGQVEESVWFYGGGTVRTLTRIVAETADHAFRAYYFGLPASPTFAFTSPSPMTTDELRHRLAHGYAPFSNAMTAFEPELVPPFNQPLAVHALKAADPAAEPATQ